ncbi:hypothetical protein HD806DRAFT_528210 [Xylariaceae sp. AK1471]|nr:hypothetical protein HD806DRAFT_528210 [Xylariaceae sp. AK1471]
MAVLDEVPGIKVTILIDNQDVTEYVDPHASESDSDTNPGFPVISKYVKAIDDTEFSIRVAVDNDEYAWSDIDHCLTADIRVDGRLIDNCILRNDVIYPDGYIVKGRTYFQGSQWRLERLKFAAISTVEDCNQARIKKDKKTVKDLGHINVSLERHVLGDQCIPVPKTYNTNSDKLEVAEKAVKGKAISHSTSLVFLRIKTLDTLTNTFFSLSQSEAAEDFSVWDTNRVALDDGPIAVFRFMYASEESLKQELIIPRTPSPEPATPIAPRSVDNMTIAELQRLAQERLDQIRWAQEAKSGRKSALKRGMNEVVDVDEEANRVRRAKRRAVTIDLTDD